MLTDIAPPRVSAPDLSGRPHAVVIGSGFGGLAAAVRLGARGYRVTVLEKLDAPGGRAYVYRQDGFTFDAGPTIVTAPFLLEDLWRLCGRELAQDIDLRPVSPFYRIRFHDGAVFDYTGDPAAMKAEIARFSPADVPNYDRFMVMSEKIFRFGFEKLGHVPFNSWTDMARALPKMVQLQQPALGLLHGLQLLQRPQAADGVQLPSAAGRREPVPGHLDVLPDRVPAAEMGRAFRDGRDRGAGARPGRADRGAGRAGALQRAGGRDHGRGGPGDRRAPGLGRDDCLGDRGLERRFRHDLPQAGAGAARRRWTDRKLARASYSMGLFVWYFGTRRQYPDVAHHTIALGPRYRELLDDIFKRKVLAEDFSLYLHRPTATDPSLAPPGQDAFYVLSPVPNLASGTDWRVQAEPYRQKIARHLSATILPGLENEIVTSLMLTPQDFQDRLSSVQGAGFGLEPVLTQSAWFRPHNRSEDVAGLYLVGAGTHPGAGMPGVITSARVLDSVVPDAVAWA